MVQLLKILLHFLSDSIGNGKMKYTHNLNNINVIEVKKKKTAISRLTETTHFLLQPAIQWA